MLDVYIRLVEEGKRAIESIPDKYRVQVKEVLGIRE